MGREGIWKRREGGEGRRQLRFMEKGLICRPFEEELGEEQRAFKMIYLFTTHVFQKKIPF